MNKHLRNYIRSFRFGKDYLYTLGLDVLFFGIIALALYSFNKLVTQQAYLISNGKTTVELKQMLMSMDPVKAQAMLASLKSFVFTFVVGIVILVVGGFLLYSLSRKLIWNRLTGHKTKYWRWNILNLVLLIPLLIYLIFYSLVKIFLGSIISLMKNQIWINIFDSILSLGLLIGFLIFLYLVYSIFCKKYEVWESMGLGFKLIKKKWSRIWPLFIFSIITGLGVSLIWIPFNTWFFGQTIILGIISGGLSLIYLAWLRIYLYHTVKE